MCTPTACLILSYICLRSKQFTLKTEKMIQNAVIIHGPGRSGTTLLSNMLSLHPDFFWLSGYNNRFPFLHSLSLVNNIQRVNAIEKLTRGIRGFPRPAEAYGFWSHYAEDFLNGLSQAEAKRTIAAINKVGRYSAGKRFITKITGMSRAESIAAIFDNPKIVWIDRHPPSVIASYYKQKWFYKNRPIEYANKDQLELIKFYTDYYESIQEDKKRLSRFDLLSVNYEDLINDIDTFFKEITDFLRIDGEGLKSKIDSWDISRKTNVLYRTRLTSESLEYLDSRYTTNK